MRSCVAASPRASTEWHLNGERTRDGIANAPFLSCLAKDGGLSSFNTPRYYHGQEEESPDIFRSSSTSDPTRRPTQKSTRGDGGIRLSCLIMDGSRPSLVLSPSHHGQDPGVATRFASGQLQTAPPRRVRAVRTIGPRSPEPQVRRSVKLGPTRPLPLAKLCKSMIRCRSILAGGLGLVRASILFWNCRVSTPMRDEGVRLPRQRSRAAAPPRAFANPKPEATRPRTTVPLPGFPAPELSEPPGPPAQVGGGPLPESPAAELDAGA